MAGDAQGDPFAFAQAEIEGERARFLDELREIGRVELSQADEDAGRRAQSEVEARRAAQIAFRLDAAGGRQDAHLPRKDLLEPGRADDEKAVHFSCGNALEP